MGRRIEKVVTNTGTFDATWRYFYDGQKIVETRDGSGNMVQQFIHGTGYIDELIQMRVKDKGDLYVHQDANWNVIALTDLGGSVVERYVYTPYGQVTVHQDTGYGDRDGDGDVDSTDKGTVGSTCTGTVSGACRILDLDFDGDYDSTDATKFDSLAQGSMRTPGRTYSAVNQPFAHQGLLFEPEIASYQNRARQLLPKLQRFAQRDPLATRPAASSGYQDGLSLLGYARSNPVLFRDAAGNEIDIIGTIQTWGTWAGVGLQVAGTCDFSMGKILNEMSGHFGLSSGYAWSYQHCLFHCALVAHCRPLLQPNFDRYNYSIQIETVVEDAELNICNNTGDDGECRSAWQASDFCDNQLGRDCASRVSYPRCGPQYTCKDCCRNKLGGGTMLNTDQNLKEGNGTCRPYGPDHIDFPGPTSRPCHAAQFCGGAPIGETWGVEATWCQYWMP
ncbi:MAG: RHS repeat-associated core domain-containing protein [Planctomycetota bacterium]